ncbi:MAG: hypothetical protein C0459_11800 [Chitinophaga sp.]|jgi:hypothetical protein|nr:hypothetical protein [Chitinophaga sp.]
MQEGEHKKIDLKSKASRIQLKYGFDLDETSLEILHVLQTEQAAAFAKQTEHLNEVLKGMRQQQDSFLETIKLEFQKMNKSIQTKIDESNNNIDGAVKKINSHPKSLMASDKFPKSQAFWFGFGKWGLALTLLIIVFLWIYLTEYDNQPTSVKPNSDNTEAIRDVKSKKNSRTRTKKTEE